VTGAVVSEVDIDGAKITFSARWFKLILGLVVILGLAVRIAFVSAVNFPQLANDAVFFRFTAANLADGKGYKAPFITHPHKLVATAAHPPLFPALLSVFDILGLRSVGAQRLALAVVTCTSVLVMGLLGRKVAGPIAGIMAAVIAAFDPLWLQPVGTLMSESVDLIVIPMMLLLALRCLERPRVRRFAILGVAIALAVLIRSEAIDFVVLLGLPLLLFAAVPWKRRSLFGLAFVAGLVLVLGPWLIRNQVQVGGAVFSDQEGLTLAGSYCTKTFDPKDPTYGSFNGDCADGLGAVFIKYGQPPNRTLGWTELALDRSLTSSSETYARQHLGQLPGVVLAREASTWGLGNHTYQLDLAVAGGRNRTYEELGWISYWILLPFVLVGGFIVAKQSWRRLSIMMVPIVVVALNVAITYGSTRFRIAAEPTLAVLAAVGLVAVAGSARRFVQTSLR
jgi:Dolichyl-phosphate-mannose-protein mannosyltransferase